jgi:hypothetical protein
MHLILGAKLENVEKEAPSTENSVCFDLAMATRHGIVSGATGSGKTVTLQVLAEMFAKAGVPVIAPDIKGDLSGIAMPATVNDTVIERAKRCGITNYEPAGVPVVLWKLARGCGHPLRTTVSELGPFLLSSILSLNPTQEAVLTIVFRYADEEGLLLLDFKDLVAVIDDIQTSISDKDLDQKYGRMSNASLTAIKRQIMLFGEQGGDQILGEPALEIHDLMRTTSDGKGIVSVIHAEESLHNPKNYTNFLLWLLSELFETLDEVGEVSKPRLVFFFDEAHLLFEDQNSPLVKKLETIIRLIRSRGVGVYFVTQRPHDIPSSIASQLGNRIQHALRAFTPTERKAVKEVVSALPCRSGIDLFDKVTSLSTGVALVSLLNADGSPQEAREVMIRPPASRIGALSDSEREGILKDSLVGDKYEKDLDRESAYELLKERARLASEEQQRSNGETEGSAKKTNRKDNSISDFTKGALEGAAKHFIRNLSYRLGNQLIRGIMGSLSRK